MFTYTFIELFGKLFLLFYWTSCYRINVKDIKDVRDSKCIYELKNNIIVDYYAVWNYFWMNSVVSCWLKSNIRILNERRCFVAEKLVKFLKPPQIKWKSLVFAFCMKFVASFNLQFLHDINFVCNTNEAMTKLIKSHLTHATNILCCEYFEINIWLSVILMDFIAESIQNTWIFHHFSKIYRIYFRNIDHFQRSNFDFIQFDISHQRSKIAGGN